MNQQLDAYINRLQNLPSFNIYLVSPDGHEVSPWFEVNSQAVAQLLVVNELNLSHQVEIITAQIQEWGRFAAMAERVWQIEERGLRVWKACFLLSESNPEGKDEGWKKPTQAKIEASYRVHPQYAEGYVRIERAQEAYTATNMILEAFRTKKEMLKRFAYRHHDDGAARLSV